MGVRRISEEMRQMNEEVDQLKLEILRLGQQQDNIYKVVKFGVLANDDRCASMFKALDRTLQAAKAKKVVRYRGPRLVQGVHDDVDIILRVEFETVI